MARPTQDQVDAIRKKYGLQTVAPAQQPTPSQRQTSRATEETQRAAAASGEALTAAGERRRALISEQSVDPSTFSGEVARLNAEHDLKQSAPPIYAGGYDLGTTTPLFGAVAPARPMNIAVPKSEAPGLLEAMRPQVQVDPARAQRDADRVSQVFDDAAFMETIKSLSPDEKRKQLDSYSAFKRAFAKMRHDNPAETGVTDQELIDDLKRQISDATSGKVKTFTHKPQEQLPGGIGAALQKQVKAVEIPMLEPGALQFFDELNRLNSKEGEDAAAAAAVDRLRSSGVPVMRPVPGDREGLERQVGTRPAGQADLQAADTAARAAWRQENPTKFWQTLDRDSIMANIENNAKGGTLFEKQYQTGATVESSLSHALRSVFAIPNYVAGSAMELVTPDVVSERERAARPAMYRDASAGAYNVAMSRGFMGEIQDLYRYSPSKTLRDNEWIGTTFGFAADMLGLESAAMGAAASGLRAARGAEAAAKLAGEGIASRAATATETGGKTLASTFMRDIGLPSVAEKITLGDIRLKFSGSVADNFIAIAKYDDAIKSGATHADALQEAAAVSPNSTAVEAMKREGDSFNPQRFVDDSKQEYDEFKKVYDTVQKVKLGEEAPLEAIRPYLKSVANDRTVRDAIIAKSSTGYGKYAPKMRLVDVVTAIKDNGSIDDIVSAAAVDKGFKAIDRSVGVLEPGKEIVAITPRTFGSASGADKVVQAAKQSEAGSVIAAIRREKPTKISFRQAGQTVDDIGFAPGTNELDALRRVLSHEANTGTIPNSAVRKALSEIQSGFISNESLREITYSVVDGIAQRMQAARRAETFSSSALHPTVSKVIDYGAQSNSIKLKIDQITKSITDRIGTSEQFKNRLNLSPEQNQLIADAKSKFSEIDKTMKREFNALDTADSATLSEYGLPQTGATPSQKMAAITLGRRPDALSKKNTLNNWLRSTIFGTQNVSASRFLGDFIPKVPGFDYEAFDSVFNAAGREKIDGIVSKWAERIVTPDDALQMLPQMTDEVMQLVGVMKRDASGAVSSVPEYLYASYSGKRTSEIFSLSTRPEEAMIGTYARNKGDLIFQDTLSRILSFDALATSQSGQIAAAVGLDYDGILQAAVAHNLSGGVPVNSIDELLKIPAVRKIDQKFFQQTGSSLLDLANGSALSNFVEDVKGTSAVIARKFKSGVPAIDYADEISRIARGDIKISELGEGTNPFSLRQAVRQELGSGAKYNELQVELGKLAEEEAKGSRSAAAANRAVNSLFDTFNSFFYNAILSYNPRFHGRNFFFAPSIVHMTTGIGLNPNDMIRAARVLDAAPTSIIAVDRLGNAYTAQELYKTAIESGVLKSAASTAIDSRFLDEAAKLGLGDRLLKGKAKQVVSFPSHMANAEDNLWRLATIVHAIDGGETLEGAMRLGRRSLFDFGATTAAERQYVAGKIMFYNYFRNSVIQGVRTLLENPSRILKQYRLVTDVTKMSVGDESWNDLRLYAPMDAGVAAIATKWAPKAGREGGMTVLPNMPYADAAIIVTGLMYQPLTFLGGQPDLVTGEVQFGSGYAYEKLRPMTQTAVKFLAGKKISEDVKTKKNQLSLVHVAFADALERGSGGSVPALKALTTMFNVRTRDALPGEESFRGKVYEMNPDDFENYKQYVFGTLNSTGAQRFVDEWSKIYGAMLEQGFSGPKQRGWKEIIGLQTTTPVSSPISKQTEAMQTSSEMLKQGTTTIEEEAGMKRRAQPAASQRVK